MIIVFVTAIILPIGVLLLPLSYTVSKWLLIISLIASIIMFIVGARKIIQQARAAHEPQHRMSDNFETRNDE